MVAHGWAIPALGRVSKKIEISRLAWAALSNKQTKPPQNCKGSEASSPGSAEAFGPVRVNNVRFCKLCNGVVIVGCPRGRGVEVPLEPRAEHLLGSEARNLWDDSRACI